MARAGDKEAFGQLADRYQRMAERISTRLVADEDIAKELAQESMLQAYLSLVNLRADARFQSWLYGIVLNVCKSHIRSRSRAPLSLESLTGGLRFEAVPFGGIEPDPHEIAEAQELHRLVLRAIDTLSTKMRAATLLFYYEQLSVREIAATLNVSVVAVKGRLHAARRKLRELLSAPVTETSIGPRRRAMVPVTIADVIQREPKVEEAERYPDALYAVILLDEAGRRVLPVWMAASSIDAIFMGLTKAQVARPLTFTFVSNILDAMGAELEEVRVEALRGDTFYAVAKLRSDETVFEVDARPSDAIALALHTGSPIYAAEEVMKRPAWTFRRGRLGSWAKGSTR